MHFLKAKVTARILMMQVYVSLRQELTKHLHKVPLFWHFSFLLFRYVRFRNGWIIVQIVQMSISFTALKAQVRVKGSKEGLSEVGWLSFCCCLWSHPSGCAVLLPLSLALHHCTDTLTTQQLLTFTLQQELTQILEERRASSPSSAAAVAAPQTSLIHARGACVFTQWLEEGEMKWDLGSEAC